MGGRCRGSLAQLVEQRPFKPWVLGSSPRGLILGGNAERALCIFCFEAKRFSLKLGGAGTVAVGQAVISTSVGRRCYSAVMTTFSRIRQFGCGWNIGMQGLQYVHAPICYPVALFHCGRRRNPTGASLCSKRHNECRASLYTTNADEPLPFSPRVNDFFNPSVFATNVSGPIVICTIEARRACIIHDMRNTQPFSSANSGPTVSCPTAGLVRVNSFDVSRSHHHRFAMYSCRNRHSISS